MILPEIIIEGGSMRVPHSPHSLRKVMPVASVKQPSSDNEDFNMDASNLQDSNHKKEQEDTDLGASKPSQASRPPRPIYTPNVKHGKHMVEVEALSTMEKNREFFEKNSMMDVSEMHEPLKEGSTNVNNMSDKDESFKADPNKVAESMSNKNISFHRGRERTRVSAVQRLVERKLAQKEKEKIRQREQDEKMRSTSAKNDLSSVHRRSASTNGYISMDALSRNRSKDRSGTRNDSRVLCSPDLPSYSSNNMHNESSNNSNKTCRTYKENKYLASLLLRTSRSCDRLYGDSNEATKTFITISSGKPTRIREQSPCKRDKSVSDQRWRAKSIDRTSTGSSISSGSSSSDEEISSPPIKVAKSVAPNFTQKVDAFLKSDTVLGKTAPLKSTGLLKEFSFIKENCQTPETEKKKETKARKTSYTTEKTIQINSESKNRRLSVDINLLSKNNSSSSAARFNFDHKRCNNSPTSDLASSPSDLSTSSSSTQSSSSSSLIGSDESSNGSIDSSSHLSSPNQASQRKTSKSTDKTPSSDDSHLSKRRISLEQRFKARLIQPTMFPSTEKSGHEKDSEKKGSSPQPRTRERKKSKLSSAAALKIAQLNSTKLNSSSSSDSSSSNSSFQQNISETEAYCYDVENIISKEGHKYQKVSVTTKGDSRGSSTVTNAVPRRRVSQGNLAGPSSHQNRLPKGPSPRRRKHSAPVHLNKRCDNFEEKEEEIYNNQEELGFMSKLSGSRSNLFTNRSASNISYLINIDNQVENQGGGQMISPNHLKMSSTGMHETPNPKTSNINDTMNNNSGTLYNSLSYFKNPNTDINSFTNHIYPESSPNISPNCERIQFKNHFASHKHSSPSDLNLDSKRCNNDFEYIPSGDGPQITKYKSFTPTISLSPSSSVACNMNENPNIDINVYSKQVSQVETNKSGLCVKSIEPADTGCANSAGIVSNYIVRCAPISKVTLSRNTLPDSDLMHEDHLQSKNDSLNNWLNDSFEFTQNSPISINEERFQSPKHPYNMHVHAQEMSNTIRNRIDLTDKNRSRKCEIEETFYQDTNILSNLDLHRNKTFNHCIGKATVHDNNCSNQYTPYGTFDPQSKCFPELKKTVECTSNKNTAVDPKTSYLNEGNSCRVYRSTSPPSRNLTPCTPASSCIPAINSTNIDTKKQHAEKVSSCCPQYFDGQNEIRDVPDNNRKMLKKMPIKTEKISLDIETINMNQDERQKERGNKSDLGKTDFESNEEEEPSPLLKLHRLKMLQQHRVMQQKQPRDELEFQKNFEIFHKDYHKEDKNSSLMKRRSSILSNASNNYADDDLQSISTVSGSGINFFRNVVRKHGNKAKEKPKPTPTDQKMKQHGTNMNKEDGQIAEKECKDCESQFRQKVLIDRLVSDTILSKAWLAGGGLPPSRLAKEFSASTESQHDQCENNNSGGNLHHLSSLSTDSNSNFSPSKGSSVGIMVSSISNASTSCESRCAVHQALLSDISYSECKDDLDVDVKECDSISSAPFNGDIASTFDVSGIADDEQSISTRSSVSMSTVSGSGLLFLRNYIRKKVTREQEKGIEKKNVPKWNEPRPNVSQFFNSVPVPFPPVDKFYGPTYVLPDDVAFQENEYSDEEKFRRQSYCSTIADLLDTFDSEDSELRNLEWDDIEGDDDPIPEDIYNYYQLLQGIEQLGKLPLDAPLEETNNESEDIQNEGRITVLQNKDPKTPTVDHEAREIPSSCSNNFNSSAIPYTAVLPGSYKDEPTLPNSFKDGNELSKSDAVKCLTRSISRARSRHSGSCSNNLSNDYQSPIRSSNQQSEIGSRSSTVMYKTPTTSKSFSTNNLESLASTTNLESLDTEQESENYFSIPPTSQFSPDSSIVLRDQSSTFNQAHFPMAQTPPLAISSPHYKHVRRNSTTIQCNTNIDGEKNVNSKYDIRRNNENQSIPDRTISINNNPTTAKPIVTSDHSSLASLFSNTYKNSEKDDGNTVSCNENRTLLPQTFSSENFSNHDLSHHLKKSRMKNMSLENIQWDKVNVPPGPSTFSHTNIRDNVDFKSGHVTGSSTLETFNTNINKNRLANFWEKTVSSTNDSDSNMQLGQTKNLSRRLKDMTSNTTFKSNNREFRRSFSDNVKEDAGKNLEYYHEAEYKPEKYTGTHLNWNEQKNHCLDGNNEYVPWNPT